MRGTIEPWESGIGCIETDSATRPPKNRAHAARWRRRHASAVHQGNQTASDSCWRNGEKCRAGEGWHLVPILPSFSLAAPGAQWCNTGDLFVTDRPRFPPAADWPGAGMNGPLCFWSGGGLGGGRQRHVTPLRKKLGRSSEEFESWSRCLSHM